MELRTLDRKIANFAKENGLTGFEFLSCIPGSIGGAVIMNSGCYENDISRVLKSIKVIDLIDCQEKEIPLSRNKIFYRGQTSQSNNNYISHFKRHN